MLSFFVFIFYSAEANQLPGFYQHFIWYSVELCHGPGFFYYYYFWRVEVKVTCCRLEVFHEPGPFCVFTISGFSWLAILFLSSIALKLTSFLDFISIFSVVARNYPTCQAFFYFWRVKFKVTCCSLEVFHEPSLFCVFTLWLTCLAFLFLSSIALKLISFLDFISILSAIAWDYPTCRAFFFYFWRVEVKVTCCSLEVFHEPGLFCVFTLSCSLAWRFCFYLI